MSEPIELGTNVMAEISPDNHLIIKIDLAGRYGLTSKNHTRVAATVGFQRVPGTSVQAMIIVFRPRKCSVCGKLLKEHEHPYAIDESYYRDDPDFLVCSEACWHDSKYYPKETPRKSRFGDAHMKTKD